MPATSKPRRLAIETLVVCGAALLLTLFVLRAGAWWTRGVVGRGDAWQMLWSIDHVQRALRGEEPFYFSPRVFAPEGASLRAHGLSPANTLPAAFLARRFGLFTAYNTTLLFSFVLAAGASYRLARRLGASASGAALGAFVFAFAPQRMGRALGHLNLLAIGWLPLALEGLLLASRETGRRRAGGVALGALSLAALAYSEWYLAIMGVLAASSFAAFEVVRAPRARRGGAAAALAASGLLALGVVGPAALAVARETTGRGHDPRALGASVTSLFIPSPVQLSSHLTSGLTARERLTPEEGSNYLGFVPLAALLAVAVGKRRERELDFAVAAGAVSLALSLGPVLWVFATPHEVPLPYSALEKAIPALRLGGATSRFQALAFLPLALGVAFATTRLVASGKARVVAATAVVLAAEFAPADPGHSVWPFDPPDPAMAAITDAKVPGNVFDVDPGNFDMIHQLQHGRPQTFGCLSRIPYAALKRRWEDPVIGAFMAVDRPAPDLPPAVTAAWLRNRWNVAFLVSPSLPQFESKTRALGFPQIARSERGDRAVVYRVPEEPLPHVERIDFLELAAQPPLAAMRGGVFAEGLHGPETPHFEGREERGCWTGADVTLFVSLAPGDYRLRLAAPGKTAPLVTVRWGKGRETSERVVERVREIPLRIEQEDRFADGLVKLELHAAPTLREGWKGGRELGVFLVSLSR
ncbi:MAG TPA: hypothetical protein VLJ18_03465 [Thermoanaerobaculia bacterium]|nr:hypothetical protein [Thermoanaerobaculia bacterium]